MKLINIANAEDILHLQVTPLPQWEEFIPFASQLLQKAGITTPFDLNEGADRHMVGFTFNSARFSLNYESYSESIWIAPEESASIAHLGALQSQLQSLTG